MALRNIVEEGDPVLRKVCKPVKEINGRILQLLDDLKDTMYSADGVGLAAPQVGVIRRIAVVDAGEGLYELINPELIFSEGDQYGDEGCLSVPGKAGPVHRPQHVIVRSLDRKGNTVEYEGFDLQARAFLHEMDHLDGILYIDKADSVRILDGEE